MEQNQLREALQLAIKQINQDDISVSYIPMNTEDSTYNLDQLEPSFMYSQIFKEIFLEMNHDEKAINQFVELWRRESSQNAIALNIIAEFEHDYRPQSAIWWYTREYFIYHMLNWSLRTLESDVIMKMAFFIHDLDRQL